VLAGWETRSSSISNSERKREKAPSAIESQRSQEWDRLSVFASEVCLADIPRVHAVCSEDRMG